MLLMALNWNGVLRRPSFCLQERTCGSHAVARPASRVRVLDRSCSVHTWAALLLVSWSNPGLSDGRMVVLVPEATLPSSLTSFVLSTKLMQDPKPGCRMLLPSWSAAAASKPQSLIRA